MKKIFVLLFLFTFASISVYAASNAELIQRKQELTNEINSIHQQYMEAGAKGDSVKLKQLRERHNALVKERNQLDRQLSPSPAEGYANDQRARIAFFNKMKSCQPSSVKTILFTETVTGEQNGYCYFKMELNNKKARTECRFPMSVALKYAQESINGINQGKDLPSTRAIINNPSYCKDYFN